MRVLVVGAGIAGLSTALRLRQLGADGANSAVRRDVLARQEWCQRDLGHTVAAWIQDGALPAVHAGDFTTLTAPGRMVAVYPAGGGRTAVFFAHRSSTATGIGWSRQ